MARKHEFRLMAKVARMYYHDGCKQSDIATRLDISQASVSRLLKQGLAEGVVRITVTSPQGTYTELERALEERYGVTDVVIADCEEDREPQVLAAIGEAAAHYLENAVHDGETIGVSSWSQVLLKMVDNLHPQNRRSARRVVQTLGGMGNPVVQEHATQLTTRLAGLLQAEPVLLPSPGVATSKEAKLVLIGDPYVRAALETFSDITLALHGIGAIEPSEMLAKSGNVFSSTELERLTELGAVGDISLRFFDIEGKSVQTPLDARVIGISLEELAQIPRVVGIAGGQRKTDAIRGALAGKVVDVLITDHFTARRLVEAP